MNKKLVVVGLLMAAGVAGVVYGVGGSSRGAIPGIIGGCCLGAGAGLLREVMMSKRNRRVVRTDVLPEPLVCGRVLYEATVENPLAEWKSFDRYQRAEDVRVVDGWMQFSNPVRSSDEWDYIYLDAERYGFRDCSWSLRFRRHTTFREYAFNFRYQDFDNRYRYRFEDDKIFFDKKVAGVWTNNIASCPFPMISGQWYDLRIDAARSLSRCYVDGELRMENVDTDLEWGSVCIILWEDDGETPISAEIGVSVVRELETVCEKGR